MRPLFAGEWGSQGTARHEACGAHWRRDVFSISAQQLAAQSIGWLSLVVRSGTLTGSFTAYCGVYDNDSFLLIELLVGRPMGLTVKYFLLRRLAWSIICSDHCTSC